MKMVTMDTRNEANYWKWFSISADDSSLLINPTKLVFLSTYHLLNRKPLANSLIIEIAVARFANSSKKTGCHYIEEIYVYKYIFPSFIVMQQIKHGFLIKHVQDGIFLLNHHDISFRMILMHFHFLKPKSDFKLLCSEYVDIF